MGEALQIYCIHRKQEGKEAISSSVGAPPFIQSLSFAATRSRVSTDRKLKDRISNGERGSCLLLSRAESGVSGSPAGKI